MRLFFRRIHLYLGLAAGLVLTITCATGALLVFEEELQHFFYHDRYYVVPAGSALSVETLAASVRNAKQQIRVTGVKMYADRTRTAEVKYVPDEKGGLRQRPTDIARKKSPKREGGARAFINPNTGAIIEWYNYRETGFYTVFALHRWLLSETWGKLVVGVCTLIFLFIIGTGIVLWWPRNMVLLKQRLRLKRWVGKRGLHDLHVVLGFYCALPLFILAFTGLAWSFEWFNKGVYAVMGSSSEPPKPLKSSPVRNSASASPDAVLRRVLAVENGPLFWQVSFPKDSSAALTITVLPQSALIESATTAYHFDQYNGRLLKRIRFADRSPGQQVRSAFKPIHTGAIWGWPSKVVAFIACLVGASMPLTGTLMWLSRVRKKRRRAIMAAA